MGKGCSCPVCSLRDDPIRALKFDLQKLGKPSLPWLVKWSATGKELVSAAWRVTKDDFSMNDILLMAWLIDVSGAIRCKAGCGRFPCHACCHAVRKRFPVPPTLAELMAARAR